MSTLSQIRANRENSKKSTGPLTPEGKSASSSNRLQHGIYSSAILLPHEDPDAYQSLCDEFFSGLQPQGPLERGLVQRLIDCQWRMNRLDAIEASLYAAYYDEYGAKRVHPDAESFKFNTQHGYLPEISKQFARQERIYRRAMIDLLALQAQRKSISSPKLASFPLTVLPAPADPHVPTPSTPEENSKAA